MKAVPAPKDNSSVPFLADEPKPTPKPVVNSAKPKTRFDSPFPEGSEAEADGTKKKTNPFTGLKLADDKPAATKKPAAIKLDVEEKQPELRIEPATRTTKKAVVKIPETKVVEKPAQPANLRSQPAVEVKSDSPADKLRRIAERSGLKGLKGFCPVVLRDERDLIDANPAISSVHKGTTYSFSSRRAKALFDKNPQKYSPAASGRDVVKLGTYSESVEGSLDHAVWFRDRLYLFSDAESLRKFTGQPKRFAVPGK